MVLDFGFGRLPTGAPATWRRRVRLTATNAGRGLHRRSAVAFARTTAPLTRVPRHQVPTETRCLPALAGSR
jgi:hypothetical protein